MAGARTAPRCPLPAPAIAPELVPHVEPPETAPRCRGQRDGDDGTPAHVAAPLRLLGQPLPSEEPTDIVVVAGDNDPVDALFLAWDAGLEAVQTDIVVATVVYTEVPVYFLHDGPGERADLEHRVAEFLVEPDRVRYIDLSVGQEDPTVPALDSPWIRDWGPMFVTSLTGRLSIIDTLYGLDGRQSDDVAPREIGRQLGIPVHQLALPLDGGNLVTDGQGTCYTAFGPRIPDWQPEEEVELQLRAYLGCAKVHWIPALHEELTGHVDVFLKLASETHVLLGSYDPEVEPRNAQLLDDTAAWLGTKHNANGERLVVSRVPMPAPSVEVYPTHLNTLVINDVVMVPVYHGYPEEEQEALDVFRRAFPGKRLVCIRADSVVDLGGALRCISRTRPRTGGSAETALFEDVADDPAILDASCGTP